MFPQGQDQRLCGGYFFRWRQGDFYATVHFASNIPTAVMVSQISKAMSISKKIVIVYAVRIAFMWCESCGANFFRCRQGASYATLPFVFCTVVWHNHSESIPNCSGDVHESEPCVSAEVLSSSSYQTKR